MAKPLSEIFRAKPDARPRIYAYAIHDEAHKRLLKVGRTTREVKQRVAEQLKTAAINNYTIVVDEFAERNDGSTFKDHEVHASLIKKGFERVEGEWFRCTVADVRTVLNELRTGKKLTGARSDSF